MGTFSDPILADEGTLIRDAIQSPNYVPGVSGWAIKGDGTAEFADGLLRGEVHVGDAPAGSGLVVSTEVPQTLIDWYGGVAPAAAMLYYGGNPAVYWFDLVWDTIRIHGYVAADQVRETFREPLSADPADIAVFTIPAEALFQSAATFDNWVNLNSDVFFDGRSAPRGLAGRVCVTGSPVATAAVAETAIATVPSYAYAAGRAYEVTVRAQVTPTATLDIVPRIRKGTGVAGALLVDCGRMQVQLATGGDRYFTFTAGFITAGAVSAALTFTASTSAGTLPFKGLTAGPLVVEVRDVGAAVDFPTLPTLT